MIYNRNVIDGQKGEYSHFQEINADTLNSIDSIHPQYNNVKGDYSIVEINRLLSGYAAYVNASNLTARMGISIPFKLLKDESLSVSYNVIGIVPVGMKHYCRLYCKGILLFDQTTTAINGTNTITHTITITGEKKDGYLGIGAIYTYPVTGGMLINNLIIT